MINSLPHLLYHQGLRYAETTAQLAKDCSGVFQPVSYAELSCSMLDFAAGLVAAGTERGGLVGLISDDRPEWQTVSLGIMAAGCADIPRGTDVTVMELSYILSFTECRTVCVENPYVLEKLCSCLDALPLLETVILIDDRSQSLERFSLGGVRLVRYADVTAAGKKWRAENSGRIEEMVLGISGDSKATVIFTSGTTGTPKGVELTHRNFLVQLPDIAARLDFHRADRVMCILPVWHVYERLMEFYTFYFAGTLCYSKPAVTVLLADLQKVRPQFMPCVPRVWDGIHQAVTRKMRGGSRLSWLLFRILSGAAELSLGIRDVVSGRSRSFRRTSAPLVWLSRLLYIPYGILFPLRLLGDRLYFSRLRQLTGGRFIAGMSGGGGLPANLDRFFNAIGITLLEGYGLTETAPIVALRSRFSPVRGTIGKPMPYDEVRILDDSNNPAAQGQKGVLFVRGPNVMKGYFRRPDLTAVVLSPDGWFNTGDIAVMTRTGELVIRGRQKDTIVLRSGENVEPFPIEAKLAESPYISQAVVVGQDRNSLGAIVIPDLAAIRAAASAVPGAKSLDTTRRLLNSAFAKELVMRELERLICARNGFKNYERVSQFSFLEKFERPEEELSAKGGIVRYRINRNYRHLIDAMYADERKRRRLADMLMNLPGIQWL